MDAETLSTSATRRRVSSRLRSVAPSAAAAHVRVHLPEALQEAFGPTVTVAAGPTDTLAAVAALVEAHTGVPADNLSYSFLPLTSGLPSDSTPLPVTDDKSTLAALGISNGGALGTSVAAGAVAVAPAFVVRIRLPPCLQPAKWRE